MGDFGCMYAYVEKRLGRIDIKMLEWFILRDKIIIMDSFCMYMCMYEDLLFRIFSIFHNQYVLLLWKVKKASLKKITEHYQETFTQTVI